MSSLDLGTLRGSVDLDMSAFDRKYGEVDKLITQLERRDISDLEVDADVSGADKRIGEIQQTHQSVDGTSSELVVVGDVSKAESSIGDAQSALGAIDGTSAEVGVDADSSRAEQAIDAVEKAGESLARREFDPQIDADIAKAQAKKNDIERELTVLRRMEVTPAVTADIKRAEKNLGEVRSRARALDGLRAEMAVEADTSQAEAAIGGLGAEGDAAGEDAGKGLSKGVIAALATIPIAGAVVGIGAAIGGALIQGIEEGLAVELSRDLFSARTGLDEATSRRFGLAAGNSYASAFGESTEANLDTARHALQQGLIDEDATQEQITAVINQLTGITEVFEYDIPGASRAVGQMLKTGLVADAEEAFDLIAKTSQGAISDDLMDTLNEYSGQFEMVGLDGADAMGLIRQAMDAGARDTDKVADAVKEMGLRIREGTDPAIEAMEILGVDVEKVREGFNKGGPAAREAMGIVFDALGTVEDKGGNVQQVIADLFGGPGEDLGASLFALDLGTAQDALGETEGAAQRLLDTIGENSATEIEGAQRNIETAADGIKAALASAFSDDIAGASDWVAANRGPIMEFFKEAGNGVLDLAEMGLESAASMTEGFTGFISGTLPPFLDGLGSAAQALGVITNNSEMATAGVGLKIAAENARELGESGQDAAEDMRGLQGGLDDIRAKFNDEIDPQIMSAKVHDAVTAMTGRLGELGAVIDEAGGDVTINGDTMNAEQAMEALMGMIDEETGEVTINGETYPADEALNGLMGAVGSSKGDVTIDATRAPADAALESLLRSVENSWENVNIDGNKVPADRVLQQLRGQISSSSEDVTMGANDYPASSVLWSLMRAVRNGRENITIDGNTYPADVARRNLLGAVSRSGASISVDAATWDAESSINYAARNRDSYITVHTIGALNAGDSRTNGGVTRATGGPIYGPGSGTSDDVPIMASNGEHMWSTAEVNAAGGHDAMFAMRQAVLAGDDVLALAGNGPVSDGEAASVSNHYPVQGSAPASAPSPAGPSSMTGTLYLENGALLGQVRMAVEDDDVVRTMSKGLASQKRQDRRS